MKTFSLGILAATLLAPLPQSFAAGFVLADNKGDHTLGLLDPVTGKQVAAVNEEGTTGHEVVATPDGKFAFVPIYGNAGVGSPGTDGRLIQVIDLASRKITGTIDFGRGLRPHCPVIGPKDGLLYVTTEISQTVTVIDPATLKIMGTIPTGRDESHMLALSHDGQHGYTANVSSGTVSVLDIPNRKLITVIPVASGVQRIGVSTDDKWVFTCDTHHPRLAVIDAATNGVTRWVDLPGMGYGASSTLDGRWLLVPIPKEMKVAVVDLKTMTVAHTIAVPRSPQEILISPEKAEAYVSCNISKQVAVIDLNQWTVSKLISTGPNVDGLAWANRL